MTTIKDQEVDQLLRDGLVRAPSGFANDVMTIVRFESEQERAPDKAKESSYVRLIVQTFALLIAGVIGLSQTVAFVFSLWISSIAI